MNEQNLTTRRRIVKSTVFGLLAVSLPNLIYARNTPAIPHGEDAGDTFPHDRYPAIKLDIAAEVVGVSHFNLDRLKALVDPRPELAKACWDWGYGDWENAIGAASHVGRKDIIDYLIGKGAMPTIFTYAVLGQYDTVKAMITAYPGIQKGLGPHGISLLQHAKTGLQTEGVNASTAQQLINYLQALGDADGKAYLPIEETEKAKYLGDYRYGEGKEDGFSITLNMRKMISLGRLGKNGGALLRIGEHEFTYQGAPSVTVRFLVKDGRATSLTVTEPGLVITASKI